MNKYIHIYIYIYVYTDVYAYTPARTRDPILCRLTDELRAGLDSRACVADVKKFTDGVGTPDPDPGNLVNRCL